jgi:hypothetical protein
MKRPPFVIDPARNPHWPGVLDRCIVAIREAVASGSVTVRIAEVARSLDQNAKMWPMLTDFAKQVQWPVNGEMTHLDADDWKALLTAAFEQEARMAPGIRGGFVMLGARTSKYGRRKMAEFITFLYAEGNERGIVWSEPSKEIAERWAA